jgi:hypothetical protein
VNGYLGVKAGSGTDWMLASFVVLGFFGWFAYYQSGTRERIGQAFAEALTGGPKMPPGFESLEGLQ